LLTSIQQQNFKSQSNIHFSTIHEMHEMHSTSSDGMDEGVMKRALQYFHAIGCVVMLDDNTVCPDPTIIPKITAEFILPTDVRDKLLLSKGKVEILSEGDIKCLLKINDKNDPRFIFHFVLLCCIVLIHIIITYQQTYQCTVIDAVNGNMLQTSRTNK
jgi:hypothetical protein